MATKYYWVSHTTNGTQNWNENEVSEIHPFEFIFQKNKNKGWLATKVYLTNWKEISYEEYILFRELSGK